MLLVDQVESAITPAMPNTDAEAIAALAAGENDPELLAGFGAIPEERLRSIHRGAALACEDSVSKMAHALLAYLGDPESERIADASLARAIERDDVYRMAEGLAYAGARGAAVLERAHAKLRSDPSALAAKHRIEVRSGIFWAASFAAPPDIAVLLPDGDLVYLGSVADLFGRKEVAEAALARLTPPDRAQVQNAWAALDWCGDLRTKEYLAVEPVIVDAEKAPWHEVFVAVAKTSLARLSGSRQHVFSTFEREDVSLADRTDLAALFLERADCLSFRDVFDAMTFSVRAALTEADLAPGSTWDQIAKLGLTEYSSLHWFKALPRPALERWHAELLEGDDAARSLAVKFQKEVLP